MAPTLMAQALMKFSSKKHLFILLAPAVLALSGLCSCGYHSNVDTDYDSYESADTLTHHSQMLTLTDVGHGTVLADVKDTQGHGIARYALVHRDSALSVGLPGDATIVRVPISGSAILSTVYSNAIAELGAKGAIVAADLGYVTPDDSIWSERQHLVDLGSSSAPSSELLAKSGAELLLCSQQDDMSGLRLPKGCTTVSMADYLETSPIARAEWILLLGELFGRRQQAQIILADVIDRYSELVFKAQGATSPKPKVLTECEQSGIWYVPAGGSYAARLLHDAGADYPWADTEGSGSIPLNLEQVAAKAINADIWLLRAYGYQPDAKTLRTVNSRYSAFKALQEGAVYGCDSSKGTIFTDMAFHPERILAEYVAIFHPEVMDGFTPKYYSR